MLGAVAGFLVLTALGGPGAGQDEAPAPWVSFAGAEDGPGAGRHIVLIAGDEEYRSEEGLPMLAKILAVHHGFRCTVLFSSDPETGEIDPLNQTHIRGLEQLDGADLMVVFLRFREWPDPEMKHFVDFVEAGKPVVGLRTATHAFDYRRDPASPYARYAWRNERWEGGFGRQILGETWVAHHGAHGTESTRGVLEPEQAGHPILKDLGPIWGPTDVYAVGELPPDARVLLRGQVLAGMTPDAPAVEGPRNDPLMPLVWCREFVLPGGTRARSVCSTLGSARDLESAGLRRVLVNGCYWALGLEDRIPEASRVDPVGEYAPTPFGYGKYVKGLKPSDHALP